MTLLLAEPIIASNNLPLSPSKPELGIIVVGDDPSSKLYVSIKEKHATQYGVKTQIFRFRSTIEERDLHRTIMRLNNDRNVTGIIVQLPLPTQFDTDSILNSIAPEKDVDHLNPKSLYTSPMVQAVDALNNHYQLDIFNKKICLIGLGRLVGKPLYGWLESHGVEPIVVDENTKNSRDFIRDADVILAGSGIKHTVDVSNTRRKQIVIDCSGVDADFDAIKNKVGAITPPKGGIGPLTVHFLFANVLKTSLK